MVPSDTAILDDPSLLTAAGRTRRVGYNVTNWITKETEASLGRPARDYERGDENRNGNGTGDETDSPADAKKEERFPEIRAFFTPTQPLLGPQSGLLQNSNFARPFQPDFSKRAFGQAPHIYSVSEIVCVKEGEPFEIRFEIFGTTPIDTKWYWHHEEGPLIELAGNQKYVQEAFDPPNDQQPFTNNEGFRDGTVITRKLAGAAAAVEDQGYFVILAINQFGNSLLKTKLNVIRLEPVVVEPTDEVPTMKRRSSLAKSTAKIRLTSLKEQEIAARRVIEAMETPDLTADFHVEPEPRVVATPSVTAISLGIDKPKEMKPLRIVKESVSVKVAPPRVNQTRQDELDELASLVAVAAREPEPFIAPEPQPEPQPQPQAPPRAQPRKSMQSAQAAKAPPTQFSVGWDAVERANDSPDGSLRVALRKPDARAEMKATSAEDSFNWSSTKSFWETKMRDSNSLLLPASRSADKKAAAERSAPPEVVNRRSKVAVDETDGHQEEKGDIRKSVQLWEQRINDVEQQFTEDARRASLDQPVATGDQKPDDVSVFSDGLEEPTSPPVNHEQHDASDDDHVVMRKRVTPSTPSTPSKNEDLYQQLPQRGSRVRSIAAPKKKLLVLPFETLPEEQAPNSARSSEVPRRTTKKTISESSFSASAKQDGAPRSVTVSNSSVPDDVVDSVPQTPSVDRGVPERMSVSSDAFERADRGTSFRSGASNEGENAGNSDTLVFGPKALNPAKYKDFYLGGSREFKRESGTTYIGADPGSLTQQLSLYGSLRPEDLPELSSPKAVDTASVSDGSFRRSHEQAGTTDNRTASGRFQPQPTTPTDEPEFRMVKLKRSGALQSMIEKDLNNRQ